MREGGIVEATLIDASWSTKCKDGKRDLEMHQSREANDWHFGRKKHVGVYTALGLLHVIIGTVGNVAGIATEGGFNKLWNGRYINRAGSDRTSDGEERWPDFLQLSEQQNMVAKMMFLERWTLATPRWQNAIGLKSRWK